jgi:hypothetical protein
MGTRTTLTTTTPIPAHATAAQAAGRNAAALHAQLGAQLTDTINLLTQVVQDMSKGSPFTVTGAPTIASAGVGYAINEVLTFANGVQVTVNTVTSGAIATFTLSSVGSLAGALPPANPQKQVKTTGSGVGASFNFTWASTDPNVATFMNAISALS